MTGMRTNPRLLITLGDVAGIGPEIVAKAWPDLLPLCRPVVVGDPRWLEHGLRSAQRPGCVQIVDNLELADATPDRIPCLVGTEVCLDPVIPGKVSALAGRAAYDFLCTAIDRTLAGQADGIVTCPLHKEGLKLAGIAHPGHTEILAERTGIKEFGMALYVPGTAGGGLGVVHVTLHMALRDVFRHLSTAAILEKIHLIDGLMSKLLGRRPRIAVLALNPHASDGGLFGDEEATLIAPAVDRARDQGLLASGPWPADTLFVRARQGEFDGIVAMYHDQGHIALKLLGGWNAVNITAGLPLIRTSVAHGTAYDIVGRGLADPTSLIEAARVASKLTNSGSSLRMKG